MAEVGSCFPWGKYGAAGPPPELTQFVEWLRALRKALILLVISQSCMAAYGPNCPVLESAIHLS